MLKVLHTGDLHISPENFDQTLPALQAIVRGADANDPDLIVLAGDFFVKRGYLDPTALETAKRFVKDLAAIAPVVCIPGNHDATNAWDRVDSVTAAFSRLKTEFTLNIFKWPGFHTVHDVMERIVQVATLPPPNKYFYLSQATNAENVNEEISKLLEDIVRGMIANINPDLPSILIYHGTVIGGQADSEMLLSTGQDIAVERGIVGDSFSAIMAGHLHRPQQVGRFVYCGSPAPLTFGQEGVSPSYVLWKIPGGDEQATFERISLPVVHQLLTVSIGPEDFETVSPQGALIKKIGEIGEKKIEGAKIRIKARIPESRIGEWNEEAIHKLLAPAHSVKIITERIAPIKLRAEDVSIEQNIGELLGRWVDLNPELHDIRLELQELADEIENAIPVSERLNGSGSDYRPARINWENFKCYKDGEIRFDSLGHLVCISGANAAGKSNAAEAEAFALYKFLRGSSNLKDVVREGERACKVSIEFTAQENEWRVTRSVKLAGTGKASGDILLNRKNNGGWVPANAGTAPETQKKIEELVGSLPLYLSTRYGAQFDIDRLLEMRPSKLKDTLQQAAVNTPLFDLRQRIAKERARTLENDINEIQAKINQLEEMTIDQGFLKMRETEIKEQKFGLSGELGGLEGQKLKLTLQLEEARKHFDTIKKDQDMADKYREKYKKISDEIETLTKKIEGTELLLKDARVISEKMEEISSLENEESGHALKQTAHNNISEEINKLEKKLNDAQNLRTQEIEKVKSAIERSIEDAKALEKATCKGEGEYAACPFIKRAIEAKKNLSMLDKSLQALELQTLETLEPKAWKDREEAIIERERTKYDANAHQKIREKLKTLKAENWQVKAQDLARAEGELQGLRQEMKLQIAALAEVTELIDNTQVDDATYLDANLTVSDLEAKEKNLNDAIGKKREEINKLAIQEGEIKGKLETIDNAENQIKILRENEKRGVRRQSVFKIYIKAVSRDGLPFLILEQAIPELSRVTNEFLGDSPLSVEIEPLRDLASGEVRDQVTIWFQDDRGRHPLSEASGYQRMALGASLRAALAKIQAKTNGTKVHHMFLDEGFGAYDNENLQYGKQMLIKFANEFERIIYITHVTGMQEIADTVLQVTPGIDGSRIAKVS